MVFPAGVEPTAFRLGGGRSILLSYGNTVSGGFILGAGEAFVKRKRTADERTVVLCSFSRRPTNPFARRKPAAPKTAADARVFSVNGSVGFDSAGVFLYY